MVNVSGICDVVVETSANGIRVKIVDVVVDDVESIVAAAALVVLVEACVVSNEYNDDVDAADVIEAFIAVSSFSVVDDNDVNESIVAMVAVDDADVLLMMSFATSSSLGGDGGSISWLVRIDAAFDVFAVVVVVVGILVTFEVDVEAEVEVIDDGSAVKCIVVVVASVTDVSTMPVVVLFVVPDVALLSETRVRVVEVVEVEDGTTNDVLSGECLTSAAGVVVGVNESSGVDGATRCDCMPR